MNAKTRINNGLWSWTGFGGSASSRARRMVVAAGFLLVAVGGAGVASAQPSFSMANGLNVIVDGGTVGSALFPPFEVGTEGSIVFVIRNLGDQELTFGGNPTVQISGLHANTFTATMPNTAPIPGNSPQFRILTVTCSPDPNLGPGLYFGTFRILTNDPLNPFFTFNVIASTVQTPKPIMNVEILGEQMNPFDEVDLGTETIDEPVQFDMQISNEGDADLVVDNITVLGISTADAVTDAVTPMTIPPGQGTEVQVKVAPTAVGQQTAVITMPNNSDDDLYRITFRITGEAEPVGPIMTVLINNQEIPHDQTFDLGPVPVGRLLELQVELLNDGDEPLDIHNIAFEGTRADDFRGVSLPIQLQPTKSGDVTYEFSPSRVGPYDVTMLINSNGEPSPYRVHLTADGFVDCNFNDTPDADDIASGFSEDCDANAVPDECQNDTDNDGLIDPCDNDNDNGNDNDNDNDNDNGQRPGDNNNGNNGDQNQNGDNGEPEFGPGNGQAICGAGGFGLLPLAVAGFCTMRTRRRVVLK